MVPALLATWAVSAPTAGQTIDDGRLEFRLPPGWHSRVIYGGVGGDPRGLPVLIAASIRLPRGTGACDQPLPDITGNEAMIHIYDYGTSSLAPRFPRAEAVRAGRWTFAGRALNVLIRYGTARPTPTLRAAVRRILASAFPITMD